MDQLILHCNYIAFGYMATEINPLPEDRHAPSLITEQTLPKGNKTQQTENSRIQE